MRQQDYIAGVKREEGDPFDSRNSHESSGYKHMEHPQVLIDCVQQHDYIRAQCHFRCFPVYDIQLHRFMNCRSGLTGQKIRIDVPTCRSHPHPRHLARRRPWVCLWSAGHPTLFMKTRRRAGAHFGDIKRGERHRVQMDSTTSGIHQTIVVSQRM